MPKESALFAFTLDEDGRYLEETLVFSSAAWATGRARNPGPGDRRWLDGFEADVFEAELAVTKLTGMEIPYLDPEEKSWRPLIAELLGEAAATAVGALLGGGLGLVAGAVAGAMIKPLIDRPGGADEPEGERDEREPGRPVTLADIVAFHAHVADVCGLPGPDPLRLRIHSFLVSPQKDGSFLEAEPAFLNSMFPDELNLVAAGRRAAALNAYLTDVQKIPTDLHADVRQFPEVVFDALAPERFPLARWPAPSDQPLATSQQFAVNTAFTALADSGLFSVNGPPGTGKTTMLRDLIAAIIVERARKLAGLRDPKDAFLERMSWTTPNDAKMTTWSLDPKLTGFEIVVASSNNAAVENITAELPASNAIGEQWRDEAAYFASVATALLGGADAWGTIAAPLGKAENKRRFADRFWGYGKGMQAALEELRDAVEYVDGPRTVPLDWQNSIEEFNKRHAEAERMRSERQRAFEALRRLELQPSDGQAAAALAARAADARSRHAGVMRTAQAAEDALLSVQARHRGHQVTRAGRVGRFFLRQQDRQWVASEQLLLEEQERIAHQLGNAQNWVGHYAAQISQLDHAAQRAQREHSADVRARSAAERIVADARRAWPAHFPEGWMAWSQDERDLSSPWSDEEWAEARTRVFLAALDLHRAFVAGARSRFFSNMKSLQEVMKGGARTAPASCVHAAWRTLFFTVPVISTTFASCGRLFSSFGAESLGWLLIDEAGQAAPQAAVGALWRSRRAVVVGDPLQLEPVISLPLRVQDLLRGVFEVRPEWVPGTASAQSVADRVNRYGTTLWQEDPAGDAVPIWVGAPLLVHRRCQEPMFTMSNTIAYQGMMVSATHDIAFPSEARQYPRSCWVDVQSSEAKDKWIPAEGEALRQILTKLTVEFDVPRDSIRVLSPFRDVVRGCREVARELGWSWEQQNDIDTVHKMQGREADVVILVLGTHPSRSQKARSWAAADSPNLLNVAVSRARRRLFVIGDLDIWRGQRFGAVIADNLPHRPWPAPRHDG